MLYYLCIFRIVCNFVMTYNTLKMYFNFTNDCMYTNTYAVIYVKCANVFMCLSILEIVRLQHIKRTLNTLEIVIFIIELKLKYMYLGTKLLFQSGKLQVL